ncbi:hypothetical protein [Ruegeria sp. EL01]|uniref:hypothetical protein n=1 Tax=Ruegeria sp. EL01 TaxID=2107578 RepID=UPI0013C48869|nr:hypothetical protein [Ruegeria sp. EL01]
MDPFTGFMVAASAVSSLASGAAQSANAMSEGARLDSEAKLAETQTLQRDTIARDDLNSFLSTVRASRAANGLSSNSPNAVLLETTSVRNADRDRVIQRADGTQRAANFRTAAKSARRSGRFSLLTGVLGAAVPLAQYGAYKSGGNNGKST